MLQPPISYKSRPDPISNDLLGLDRGTPPTGPEWFVISQNRAKMGPPWRAAYVTHKPPVGVPHCPGCGQPVTGQDKETRREVPVPPRELERKRQWCPHCDEALWTFTHEIDKWPCAGCWA